MFAQELSEHTGVPLDAIFYTATHAHAAPEITNEIDMSYLTFEEDEEVDNLQKWGRLVYDQMMDAADEALANLEPVTMGIGYSNCYMNVNLNAKYTKADGTYYWAQGDNFEGFSDKTLAVMRFTSVETGNADLAFEYGQTMIPSSEAGEYPVDLQVLRIGKVALVGFPGEMFNEIGAGVISQSPVDDTLWVNLCWTRDNQQTGYHSTDLITVEGGQGSNKKYLPGYLEDAAAELTRKLVAESLYFNQ